MPFNDVIKKEKENLHSSRRCFKTWIEGRICVHLQAVPHIGYVDPLKRNRHFPTVVAIIEPKSEATTTSKSFTSDSLSRSIRDGLTSQLSRRSQVSNQIRDGLTVSAKSERRGFSDESKSENDTKTDVHSSSCIMKGSTILMICIAAAAVVGFSDDSKKSKNDTKTYVHSSSSSMKGSTILMLCIAVAAVVDLSFCLFMLWQKKKREEQYAGLLKLFEEDEELELELGLRD